MSEEKRIKAVLMPSSLQDCNDYCICQRYANDVFCENATCTFSGHGRVQRLCKFHPKNTYLLDLSLCPYCQSKCVEIFIPSVVGKDKGSRREPHKEELMDCKAREIISFISYEQQPYIKEQEMLTEIYSKKLPKEEYMVWKEMMQKRCFIIKKKYQLLIKQESSSSPDLIPKITMADLEKMREDLYDVSKAERDWRRSTAALKSVDSPALPKLQEIIEKPKTIYCTTPSNVQLRLLNISKESELPKSPEKVLPSKVQQRQFPASPSDASQEKLPSVQPLRISTPTTIYYGLPESRQEIEVISSLLNAQNEVKVNSTQQAVYLPPHRREKPADMKDSWRRPVKDTHPLYHSPCKLQRALQAQSQSYKENMNAIQEKHPTVLPLCISTSRTPTTIYYGLPESRQEIEEICSSLQQMRATDDDEEL